MERLSGSSINLNLAQTTSDVVGIDRGFGLSYLWYTLSCQEVWSRIAT